MRMRSWSEVSDSRLRRRIMFSPKVRKEGPCLERTEMMRLGRMVLWLFVMICGLGGGGDLSADAGVVCVATIYCSLSTRRTRITG